MRGDVYEVRLRGATGDEQQGDRYGVVVQTDSFPWSTTLLAPTSTRARPGSFRPQIQLGDQQTTVLIDQLTVVDPDKRLGRVVSRVSLAELQAIEQALRLVLDL